MEQAQNATIFPNMNKHASTIYEPRHEKTGFLPMQK